MRLLRTLRRPGPLEVGALAVAGLGAGGFWLTEPLLVVRLLYFGLLFAAAYLVLAHYDRLLLALTAIYAGNAILLSLYLTQALPAALVFAAAILLAAYMAAFLALARTPPHWILSLGVGLFVAQLFWIVGPWPFDPKSKAAILMLFFYLLTAFMSGKTYSQRGLAASFVWLFVILFVMVSLANWQL